MKIPCKTSGEGRNAMPHRAQDSLIESQLHQWEIDKMSRKMHEGVASHYSPLITISRQAGSHGVEISALTATRLNYQLLDRSIVDTIADRASIRKSAVKTLDEKVSSVFEDFLSETILPQVLSRSKYIEHLASVLVVAAEHGKAVIAGRGANFILRTFPLFRVRIVCPLKVRVERFAELKQMTLKESEARVKKSDANRAAYIRSYFRADINEATNYDLMINTERMSIEQASGIIIEAYKVAYPPREEGYEEAENQEPET
jgi:cytidylate kinase